MNATATGDIILSKYLLHKYCSFWGLMKFFCQAARAEAIGLRRHGNGGRNSRDSAPFKSHEWETILPVVAQAFSTVVKAWTLRNVSECEWSSNQWGLSPSWSQESSSMIDYYYYDTLCVKKWLHACNAMRVWLLKIIVYSKTLIVNSRTLESISTNAMNNTTAALDNIYCNS